MNDEVKTILKMVESGKISVEEGEKLISSLGKDQTTEAASYVPNNKKFLRVEVYSNEEEETKVKINIPLNLAKTVLKMNSIKNQISVNASDIELNFDEIIQLIENNAEGELINIESGKTKVRIWID